MIFNVFGAGMLLRYQGSRYIFSFSYGMSCLK